MSWSFYRASLAGEPVTINADVPEWGYYWMRKGRNGQKLPVAIFEDKQTHRLVAIVGDGKGGKESADPYQIWTWVAARAVQREHAITAFKTGAWPGDVEWPMYGDNGGPPLEEQIPEHAARAVEFIATNKIETQELCDQAANMRDLLNDLKKQAEEAHKEEKAPHLEAGRAVDAKWKPLIAAIEDAVKQIRTACTAFLKAEDDKRRAVTAAAQKAADEAAKAAGGNAVAITVQAPKVAAGGQRGKRMGLKEVTVYVIDDYATVLAAVQEQPDVRAAVQKAAERLAKAGIPIPGLRKTTEQVAA